jgi:hypothetical protein
MPLEPSIEAERAAIRAQKAHRLLLVAAGSLAFVAGTYAGIALGPSVPKTPIVRAGSAPAQSENVVATARDGGRAEPIATGALAPTNRDAARAISGAPNRMDTIDGRRTGAARRPDEWPALTADESEARWYGCRFAAQQIEWAMSHSPAPCTIADASSENSDECRRETLLIESRIKELQFEQKSLRCGSTPP